MEQARKWVHTTSEEVVVEEEERVQVGRKAVEEEPLVMVSGILVQLLEKIPRARRGHDRL